MGGPVKKLLAAMAAAKHLFLLLVAATTIDAHPLFWPATTCHRLCSSFIDRGLNNDGSFQLEEFKPSDGVETISKNEVFEIPKSYEAGPRQKRGGIFFTPPFRSG